MNRECKHKNIEVITRTTYKEIEEGFYKSLEEEGWADITEGFEDTVNERIVCTDCGVELEE